MTPYCMWVKTSESELFILKFLAKYFFFENLIIKFYSIDVIGLYSNIPHKEAAATMREGLDSRQDKTIPTAFTSHFMQQV